MKVWLLKWLAPLKWSHILCTRTKEKMPQRHLGNWPGPTHCRLKGMKSFEKRATRNFPLHKASKQFFLWVQPPRDVEVTSIMVQEDLATAWAYRRPWHCPCDAECKSYRVMEASTHISKESLGDQPICDRVRVPIGSPWVGDAWICDGEA
jgi:hypothetical protein